MLRRCSGDGTGDAKLERDPSESGMVSAGYCTSNPT